MKRFFATILASASIFALAACTDSAAFRPADKMPSPEKQIEVMVAAKDMWLRERADISQDYYALCDLNDNGRLELIVGTDQNAYVYSPDSFPDESVLWETMLRFFEISADGSSLEELSLDAAHLQSHPDMMDADAYRLYVGPHGRSLVDLDICFPGPFQGADDCILFVLDSIEIGEGKAKIEDIAWAAMMAADSNADGLIENQMKYFAPGEDVTAGRDGDWYVAAPDERFAGCEEFICSMEWVWLQDGETSDDILWKKLNASWAGYSVWTDTDGSYDYLVRDPYDSFFAQGAGGVLYRPGDEVFYFPSFTDVRGEWYIQKAWTDDAVWYAGAELAFTELTILEDGQLYASYSNSADPRGVYLLTEMKAVFDSKAGGTDGDDWVIVYENKDGTWQLRLSPDPENAALYVVWYEWEDEARSTDPVVIHLEYSRAAG